MNGQPRPVWLYHGDVSWLYTTEDTPQRREALARLTDGFNRAPVDSTEAIAAWFAGHFPGALDNKDLEEFAEDVLRALGKPE